LASWSWSWRKIIRYLLAPQKCRTRAEATREEQEGEWEWSLIDELATVAILGRDQLRENDRFTFVQ
jgi:hypothetical protein